MAVLIYIIYFSIAIIIGILASLFGLGGGFLIVPTLTLLGLPVHHAIGTSSAIIIFSSLSAIIEYRKQEKINYKAGILIVIPSIIGAYIGACLTMYIQAGILKIIFGIVLLFVAFRMMKQEVWREKKLKHWIIPFGGFLSGIISGLLGIGGGIINVPFLAYLGLPIHVAVATSSFSIFFTSMASAFKHYFLGNVEFIWLVLFAPAIVIGAQFGAKLAKKIKSKDLKSAFSLLLIILALVMIFKGAFS
ncbi:MAG: sulfite exporter TauE/SafE family protein [Thermoplasmata archaeon]|nr:sulfite exporter TauE/SafE family protein [Thermoplasmata archaeon]